MEIQTPELLKILSNKTNLEIINLLKNEPSYPRKISEILGMQEAYISRILTQLEKLGILRSQWAYRERNVKLYSLDTEEISIAFEPGGVKICVKTKGEREISVSYEAFRFEVPEIHGFVGRELEMQLLERSPVIVIEGMPGIGKTYLAACYVEKAKKEGKKVFWHTFTEIDSFHYLINKLSVFLNNLGYSNLLEYVKQEGKDDRILLSLFQQGIPEDAVLCFDGFQQVKDDKIIAMFRLLKTVKGKIIVTSRERPPFLTSSRTDITEIRLSSLSERESRDLLRSRGIPLEDGNLKKAHHRLGGHPLILDMFCEAVRERGVADLLESLPVHQVEDYLWSEIFEKLSEKDRQLVECISMFRVPASTEILRKVYKDGFWMVLKGLERRMLIRRQNGSYTLPSMIKEFTYRRVSRKNELHHEIALSYLEGGRLEGILEAMYHFLEAGEEEKAAELVVKSQEIDLIEQGYLSPYLEILNHFSPDVSPEIWCSIKHEKGRILVLYGDLKSAYSEFTEMLETAEEIHSEKDYAKALHELGKFYDMRGDWKKAHECFDHSLQLLEKLKDHKEMVRIHADLGNLLMREHQFKEALSHFEAGRNIAQSIGYKVGVSEMLRGIANIYYYQDQFDTALQYTKESLELAEKFLDVRAAAANYNTLGLIHFYRGNAGEAISCFEKSLKISERISDIKDKIYSYGNLGMMYADIGEKEKAEPYYREALNMAEELEDPYLTVYLRMKLALLSLQKGDTEEANALCESCLDIHRQLGESLFYGEFCMIYGMVLHAQEKWEEAQKYFEKSIEESGDSPFNLGRAYLEYSLGLKKELDGKSQEYFEKALELFEKISAEREIERARARWLNISD